MRGQHGGDEQGGGAVGSADDAHGGGLIAGETQQAEDDKGGKDADLGGCAQQQALGVGDQGSEVGHGAYAHKDEAGVNAQLDAQIQDIDEAGRHDLPGRNRGQDAVGYAGIRHLLQEVRRDRRAAEEVPVDVSAGEEDLVEHPCAGQVGDEHAEGDGHQQQRLELLHDAQEQQAAGDEDHHGALPVVTGEELHEARAVHKIQNCFHDSVLRGLSGWRTAPRRSPRRRPCSRTRRPRWRHGDT